MCENRKDAQNSNGSEPSGFNAIQEVSNSQKVVTRILDKR